MTQDQVTQALIETGRQLYGLGVVPATNGNFSARLNDGSIAITVPGAQGPSRPW